MKHLLFAGVLVSLFAGTALAECDLQQKSAEVQQEIQRLAINNPEKMDRLSEDMEKWGNEMSALADEKFNDPQRIQRICAHFDALLKKLKE